MIKIAVILYCFYYLYSIILPLFVDYFTFECYDYQVQLRNKKRKNLKAEVENKIGRAHV